MPANRSRTSGWRRCLQQICDRHGAIEIAISRTKERADARSEGDLVWRVRVLAVTESEIVVEQPVALGQTISMEQGLQLVAVLSIGQNRWTFNTTVLAETEHHVSGDRSMAALRLQMPKRVQRCQRRNYYRISTASVSLPNLEIWPLVDPASVVVAERANELQFGGESKPFNTNDVDLTRSVALHASDPAAQEDVMPEVGPKFTATMLNLGGGGIGLLVEPDDAHILNRHKLFWLRISLPPHLTVPICATAKLVHSHMESSHQIYAGMAFDFTFNPSHQRFVVDQIRQYIAVQQREQFDQQQGGQLPQRKSA